MKEEESLITKLLVNISDSKIFNDVFGDIRFTSFE